MRLVILEDSRRERQAAIAAAEAAGYTVVATSETYHGSLSATFGRSDYDGILTDLTMPDPNSSKREFTELGYQVVAEALEIGKPVVVCSGMRESYPEDLEPMVLFSRLVAWVSGYGSDTDLKKWPEAVAAFDELSR